MISSLRSKDSMEMSNLAMSKEWLLRCLRPVVHLTVSEEKQMTELVFDVARRNRINWQAVIESKEVKGILEAANLNGSQKTRRILERLREFCFPNLYRCEGVWKTELERLGRPKDIWIPLTKALESPCLEDALECSGERRVEGLKWIKEHKDDLQSLINRINSTVSIDGDNRKDGSSEAS